ncbi:hypothetical protein GCM10009712_20520 [Pseudarthrobacter sulfonivorans]|uniref:hypothetical protein n=1 Tax=Pseudarthrobacter sulfonivorans TaxID=121292 RepID=UPI00168C045D|nr:hypothetical protein [Pseudarthrobacter sulfonivorans]
MNDQGSGTPAVENRVVMIDRSEKRRRIWVQHVDVDTARIESRVRAIRKREPLTPYQDSVADAVCDFSQRARLAANKKDPAPRAVANWWRGTLVEAAYRNLHAARTQLIDLYSPAELRAEIPMVVARANATLHRDDPRRITLAELQQESLENLRPRMRRLVGDSYEKLDLEHAQLRSFRNIVLTSAGFLFLLLSLAVVFVYNNPTFIPFCFPGDLTPDAPTAPQTTHCPTASGPQAAPTGNDILVVALLGALGGTTAATLSIRNLKGTSTPYDVPVALAFLKVPLGVLAAILGLVAVQGNFVPGLSRLDSQGQILAYALIFGFAQQALSRLLDKRAQDLLEGLPGGTNVEPHPPGEGRLEPLYPSPATRSSTENATVRGEGAP